MEILFVLFLLKNGYIGQNTAGFQENADWPTWIVCHRKGGLTLIFLLGNVTEYLLKYPEIISIKPMRK